MDPPNSGQNWFMGNSLLEPLDVFSKQSFLSKAQAPGFTIRCCICIMKDSCRVGHVAHATLCYFPWAATVWSHGRSQKRDTVPLSLTLSSHSRSAPALGHSEHPHLALRLHWDRSSDRVGRRKSESSASGSKQIF